MFLSRRLHILAPGLIALLLVLTACRNNRLNPVPSYPVYLDLDIQAEYPHFVPANGYQSMTFTKRRYEREYVGYGGVLVVVGLDGKYHAMDLCCPVCLHRDSVVQLDGIYAVCPICGEQYDISYGFGLPMRGKSKWALRPYNCNSGGGHLIIRN